MFLPFQHCRCVQPPKYAQINDLWSDEKLHQLRFGGCSKTLYLYVVMEDVVADSVLKTIFG